MNYAVEAAITVVNDFCLAKGELLDYQKSGSE
jgi:hypothetical protein